jgi:hypothetical protein
MCFRILQMVLPAKGKGISMFLPLLAPRQYSDHTLHPFSPPLHLALVLAVRILPPPSVPVQGLGLL